MFHAQGHKAAQIKKAMFSLLISRVGVDYMQM